jgi:hypothetical protein
MKKLICALFGHVRRSGWWGDGLYGEVCGGYRDGIGRSHYQVRLECDRCGARYTAARFHGSQVHGA